MDLILHSHHVLVGLAMARTFAYEHMRRMLLEVYGVNRYIAAVALCLFFTAFYAVLLFKGSLADLWASATATLFVISGTEFNL